MLKGKLSSAFMNNGEKVNGGSDISLGEECISAWIWVWKEVQFYLDSGHWRCLIIKLMLR